MSYYPTFIDPYGCCFNHSDLYQFIATTLDEKMCIYFPWTDNEGTMLFISILDRDYAKPFGMVVNDGSQSHSYIVSIQNYKSYTFVLDGNKKIHSEYLGEKLGLGDNTTAKALTELLNGVSLGLNTFTYGDAF